MLPMSGTAPFLATNASAVVNQATYTANVLALVGRTGWRQGGAVLLLVVALLFVCSRPAVSSHASRLTLLLKELGRKRSRSALDGSQGNPYLDGGDEEEQRDGTRRRGKKTKGGREQLSPHPAFTQPQTFELEPLIRTDSSSSEAPSSDERTSPTNRQPTTLSLPLPHLIHQQPEPLLSTRLQSALLPHLPAVLSHVPQWHLVYSTSLHGHSLSTLYQRSSVHSSVCDGALLLCRDSDGWVFGCWTSERWERRELYYGGSDSFVFTWQPTFRVYEAREETRRRQSRERRLRCEARTAQLHDDRDGAAVEEQHDDDDEERQQREADEQAEEAEEEAKEKAAGGSGAGYYQLAWSDHIALGGGERFALWLDSAFRDGTSGPCSTFDSPTLSKRPQFKCYELEVWGM